MFYSLYLHFIYWFHIFYCVVSLLCHFDLLCKLPDLIKSKLRLTWMSFVLWKMIFVIDLFSVILNSEHKTPHQENQPPKPKNWWMMPSSRMCNVSNIGKKSWTFVWKRMEKSCFFTFDTVADCSTALTKRYFRTQVKNVIEGTKLLVLPKWMNGLHQCKFNGSEVDNLWKGE